MRRGTGGRAGPVVGRVRVGCGSVSVGRTGDVVPATSMADRRSTAIVGVLPAPRILGIRVRKKSDPPYVFSGTECITCQSQEGVGRWPLGRVRDPREFLIGQVSAVPGLCEPVRAVTAGGDGSVEAGEVHPFPGSSGAPGSPGLEPLPVSVAAGTAAGEAKATAAVGSLRPPTRRGHRPALLALDPALVVLGTGQFGSADTDPAARLLLGAAAPAPAPAKDGSGSAGRAAGS